MPETVQVGLFAASPGDLTVRRVALGAGLPESRFTQATATFDRISVDGAPAGEWSHGSVGEMGHTDWEKYHRPPGLVESAGTFTVTGTGDIGPNPTEGHPLERTLIGLAIGLIVLIVVAVRFVTTTGSRPLTGRVLAAKAVVTGGVGLLAGLVSAGVVLPVGGRLLDAGGSGVVPVSAATGLRLVLGVGALWAAVAVLALALGALLRRGWLAILVALSAAIAPYLVSAVPLLPDQLAEWLLRLTPAAGFAVQQTIREYPQMVAYYAPSGGYFPLPWGAGLAVLFGYAAAMLALAGLRLRRHSHGPRTSKSVPF